MRLKFTGALVNDAVRAMQNGERLGDIARRLECHPDNLSKAIRARGVPIVRHYRPAHNAKDFPQDECLRLYAEGQSVLALAERYGVQRKTIGDLLQRAGVDLRGGSEANLLRFAKSTVEDRQAITKAAHDAVRGKAQSHEHLVKRSASRSRIVGYGENELAETFRARGFDVEQQWPIDVYNIDLFVRGSVAVEPRCTLNHPSRSEKHRKRTEYLLSRGVSVFYVLFQETRTLMANSENVIADLDALCRLPAGRSEYRVVRCSLERFARVRNELGQLTAVPTPERPLYRRYEADW